MTLVLSIAIIIPANIGFTPFSIRGNIKYTQHTKVNINATKDLIPFSPPTIITIIENKINNI